MAQLDFYFSNSATKLIAKESLCFLLLHMAEIAEKACDSSNLLYFLVSIGKLSNK
jgi:hypothetical protein